jgi:hypothetical protein
MDFADTTGRSGTGYLVEIEVRKVRVSLNLPNSLKRAAVDSAVKDGVSLNQYTALALAEKVGSRGAADFFAERGKAGDADWAVEWLKERPE